MNDLSRRQAIKLLGSAAAASFTTADALAATPAPSGLPLFDVVAERAKAFHSQEAPALLDGTYAQLFSRIQAQEHTLTVKRFILPDDTRWYEPSRNDQRFIWGFEADEFGLHFYVTRDEDQRTAIIDHEGNSHRPFKVSKLGDGLRYLALSFQQMREIDAADIFNKAQTYDATVGGDGVCVCSLNHPHETGVWRNTFATQQDFNRLSFEQACMDIAGEFVDDQGIKIISAKPERLILPVALMPVAERLSVAQLQSSKSDPMEVVPTQGILVGKQLVPFTYWDYLRSRHAWFVKTNIDGLLWFEREPFQIVCEHDKERDAVLVTGTEKRKFGCRDPRALFGSLPTA